MVPNNYIIRDDFSHAGPNLNREPSHANNGYTWQNLKGEFEVVNGQLQPKTGWANGDLATIDAGTPDVLVTVVASAVAGSSTNSTYAGLAVRVEDDRNFLLLHSDPRSGVTVLYDFTDGVPTILGNYAASAMSGQRMNLTLSASGSQITFHIPGQKPKVITCARHLTASKVGVRVGRESGGAVGIPAFHQFIVTPAFNRSAANPIIRKGGPGTWNGGEVAGNCRPVWDPVNSRWVMFVSGFDGSKWNEGAYYSTDLLTWTEEPTNPKFAPQPGDGYILASGSNPVYVDGKWYRLMQVAPNASENVPAAPWYYVAFSSPNLTNGGTWTRLYNGASVVPLGPPGSLYEKGMHDGDLRYRTDGQFDFVFNARSASDHFHIMRASGPALNQLGTPTYLPVMGIYEGLSDNEFQPAWEGDDPQVFSVYFLRATAPADRYVLRADTEDGGVTFTHLDMAFALGTESWENIQVYDFTTSIEVNGKAYHFYTGSPVSGGVENLNGSIGMVSYSLPARDIKELALNFRNAVGNATEINSLKSILTNELMSLINAVAEREDL